MTNDERADQAEAAFSTYVRIVHGHGEPDEDNLTDLLTDLRHLADRRQVDFDLSASRSWTHYSAEVNGDEFIASTPMAGSSR